MKRYREPLSPTTIGAMILGVGVLGIAIGHVHDYGWHWAGLLSEVAVPVGAELIAVAIVILIVDRLAERRDELRLRQQLVREMGSSDHGLTARALLELDRRGWLAEGALVGARLAGAALEGAVLERVDLQGADLAGANLEGTNLSRARLSACNFTGAAMARVILEMADLTGARLPDAKLDRADMAKALLSGADLTGANLVEADLAGADLRGADLRGADLFDSRVDAALIDGTTRWDDDTHWPNGFLPDSSLRTLD